MASGADHFREAERLLRVTDNLPPGALRDGLASLTLAEAQVHATLALAAASSPVSGKGPDYSDWGAALGITTPITFASPNPNKEN